MTTTVGRDPVHRQSDRVFRGGSAIRIVPAGPGCRDLGAKNREYALHRGECLDGRVHPRACGDGHVDWRGCPNQPTERTHDHIRLGENQPGRGSHNVSSSGPPFDGRRRCLLEDAVLASRFRADWRCCGATPGGPRYPAPRGPGLSPRHRQTASGLSGQGTGRGQLRWTQARACSRKLGFCVSCLRIPRASFPSDHDVDLRVGRRRLSIVEGHVQSSRASDRGRGRSDPSWLGQPLPRELRLENGGAADGQCAASVVRKRFRPRRAGLARSARFSPRGRGIRRFGGLDRFQPEVFPVRAVTRRNLRRNSERPSGESPCGHRDGSLGVARRLCRPPHLRN